MIETRDTLLIGTSRVIAPDKKKPEKIKQITENIDINT